MTKFERNQSIYKCHKEGMSQMKIGEIFNLSQSAVSLIIIQMKNGASPSLKETRGSKSKLSDSQRLELAVLLKKPPSDHGFSVWNKWSIQALIKNQFGVKYHENYIFQVMKDIGFSSQKPKKRLSAEFLKSS